jgi:hypothetical protein
VTPLATQFTYEGIIAEVLGIDHGSTEVDPDVIPVPGAEENGSKKNGRRGAGDERGRGRGRGGSGRGRGAKRTGRGDDGTEEDAYTEEDEDKVRISLYGSGTLFNV